jgi:hypothetical protein
MPHPTVPLCNDLPLLRKIVVQQEEKIDMLLRALRNEQLLAAQRDDRILWHLWYRSES